jgi:hypothetical protein
MQHFSTPKGIDTVDPWGKNYAAFYKANIDFVIKER